MGCIALLLGTRQLSDAKSGLQASALPSKVAHAWDIDANPDCSGAGPRHGSRQQFELTTPWPQEAARAAQIGIALAARWP